MSAYRKGTEKPFSGFLKTARNSSHNRTFPFINILYSELIAYNHSHTSTIPSMYNPIRQHSNIGTYKHPFTFHQQLLISCIIPHPSLSFPTHPHQPPSTKKHEHYHPSQTQTFAIHHPLNVRVKFPSTRPLLCPSTNCPPPSLFIDNNRHSQ